MAAVALDSARGLRQSSNSYLLTRSQVHFDFLTNLLRTAQRYANQRADDHPYQAMLRDLQFLIRSCELYCQQVGRPDFVLLPANSKNAQRQRMAQYLLDLDNSLTDKHKRLQKRVSDVSARAKLAGSAQDVYLNIINCIKDLMATYEAMVDSIEKLPSLTSARAASVDASAIMAGQSGLSGMAALAAASASQQQQQQQYPQQQPQQYNPASLLSPASAAAAGKSISPRSLSPRSPTTTTTTTTTTVALNVALPPRHPQSRSPSSASPNVSPRPAGAAASASSSAAAASSSSTGDGAVPATVVVSTSSNGQGSTSSVSIYYSDGHSDNAPATVTSTTTTTQLDSSGNGPLSPMPPNSNASVRGGRLANNRFSWPAAKQRPPQQPAAHFAAVNTLGSVIEEDIGASTSQDGISMVSPTAAALSPAGMSGMVTKYNSPSPRARRLVPAIASTGSSPFSSTMANLSSSSSSASSASISTQGMAGRFGNSASNASLFGSPTAASASSSGMINSDSMSTSIARFFSEEFKEPRIQWKDAFEEHRDRVTCLPRGGTQVKMLIGSVQVGMPPETIKDSMKLGLDVPQYFVIPKRLFDRKIGINVAEFEFPSYFNFFIKRRKTILLCSPEVEQRIREVFRETLLGPESFDNLHKDFSPLFPEDDRPDLRRECDHFSRNPFDRSQVMSVDTLLEFIHFDDFGLASITKKVPDIDLPVTVHVQISGSNFVFIETGVGIASIPVYLQLPLPPSELQVSEVFHPPLFGVTALGSSHGFDPVGSTTGFVIWINGRGLMVDPPPNSSSLLSREGIPARLIDGVIVTHCHADHDAGTFQKILQEKRIMVMTTNTILQSFLRKYSALSDLPLDLMRSLFDFRPAQIGEPVIWHGAHLKFFYSFHAIPCVGFECSFGGKSLIYSADTFFVPEELAKLRDSGVLSPGRARRLIEFPFAQQDLILHEAGVPPIHTPATLLQNLLSPEVLSKLYLVHVAASAVPAGLRRFEAGVAHTIRLPIDKPIHADAIEVLDLVGTIDIFQSLTIQQAREVLMCSRHRHFASGELIYSSSQNNETFFIISRGIAKVRQQAKDTDNAVCKRYTIGDFFGEGSLMFLSTVDTQQVSAETDVECLTMDRNQFLYLLNDRPDIINKLIHLQRMRSHPSWEAFERNSLLKDLSSSQKTELQSFMQLRSLQKGQRLWGFNQNGAQSEAVLVLTAELRLVNAETQSVSLHAHGDFIGEVRALAAAASSSSNHSAAHGGSSSSSSSLANNNAFSPASSTMSSLASPYSNRRPPLHSSSPSAASVVYGVNGLGSPSAAAAAAAAAASTASSSSAAASSSPQSDSMSSRSRNLFFSETFSILDEDVSHPHRTELLCTQSGDVFVFPAQSFVEFLKRTPKLLLALLNSHVLEADGASLNMQPVLPQIMSPAPK